MSRPWIRRDGFVSNEEPSKQKNKGSLLRALQGVEILSVFCENHVLVTLSRRVWIKG